MARLHALDGMAVLIHVEDAELDRQRVESINPLLPRLVEGLGLKRIADAAKTLLAAEIMHAVHGFTPFYRRETPIMESFVTSLASFSSDQPAVSAGRTGSTM